MPTIMESKITPYGFISYPITEQSPLTLVITGDKKNRGVRSLEQANVCGVKAESDKIKMQTVDVIIFTVSQIQVR